MDVSPPLRLSTRFENLTRLVEFAGQVDGTETACPPSNFDKLGADGDRIGMAVASFGRHDLDLAVLKNALIMTGITHADADAGGSRVFLHCDIANRAFKRRFQFADSIEATGASPVKGLPNTEAVREIPDSKKARKVAADECLPGHAAQTRTAASFQIGGTAKPPPITLSGSCAGRP